MTRRIRVSLPLAAVCSVLAGLWAGHLTSYRLLIGDPVRRAHVLQATGHGYWPVARYIALTAAVAAVLSLVAQGWLEARRGARAPRLGRLVAVVAGLQVAAFVGLELSERVLSGTPIHHITGWHLVAGIAIQLAIAFGCALVMRALVRAGALLASTARRRVRAAAAAPVVRVAPVFRSLGVPGAVGARAPPAAAF